MYDVVWHGETAIPLGEPGRARSLPKTFIGEVRPGSFIKVLVWKSPLRCFRNPFLEAPKSNSVAANYTMFEERFYLRGPLLPLQGRRGSTF